MLDIGVILPSVDVQRRDRLDLPTAARHAESVGLHSVWHGDHLATGRATLDCAVALAAAAAGTRRLFVGTSVFVPAIRPLAWAAKQIATLQHVSGGRLILGVGSGGGAEQWAAAGVPYADRGPRTDTALRLLPHLLAGEQVTLPPPDAAEARLPPDAADVRLPPPDAADVRLPPADAADVRLLPAVPVPPIWVGNRSRVAIRRAARFGDGWFPSLLTAADLRRGAAHLAEAAAEHGRPTPTIAVGATGALGPDAPAREDIAAGIRRAYDMPAGQAAGIPITGRPADAADQVAAYAEAGARYLVVGFAGGDWRQQCDLFAEAAHLTT